MNYTTQNIKNQVAPERKINLFDFQGDLINYISHCRTSKLHIINTFIKLSHTFREVRVSQEQIAKLAGFKSRETANRIIAELHKEGFLWKAGVYKDVCSYKIPVSIFKYIKQLKYVLPALCLLHVSVLFSKHDHTRYYNYLLNIKRSDRYSIRDSVLLSKEGRANKKKRCWRSNGFAMINEVKGEDPSVIFGSFSPAIENFKSLALTDAGKVHLCIFPDKILKIADEQLCKRTAVKDPMGYIFGTCLKLCKENGYKLAIRLRERYIATMGIKYSDNLELYTSCIVKISNSTPTPPQKFSNGIKDNSQFNANHAAMSELERPKILDIREEYERLKKRFSDPIMVKNLHMFKGSDSIIKRFAELEALFKGEECLSIPSQEIP